MSFRPAAVLKAGAILLFVACIVPDDAIAASYVPGTSIGTVVKVEHQLAEFDASRRVERYNPGNRWPGTAGKPRIFTYSFAPDGTAIGSEFVGVAGSSSLFSNLDLQFGGNRQAWQDAVHAAFDAWTDVSGLEFVFISDPADPNGADDGAAFTTGNSATASRGDIRIGMRSFPGGGGGLCGVGLREFAGSDYGEIVLDSSESWAQFDGETYALLFQCVAREIGVAIGLSVACPINNTKLLEPVLPPPLTFLGPQLDDIRAVNRLYGDPATTLVGGNLHPNDSRGTAYYLDSAQLETGLFLPWLSVDRSDELDYFVFDVISGSAEISVSITPDLGVYGTGEYESGPFIGGVCQSGSIVPSYSLQDLRFEILDSLGDSLAGSYADATGSGGTESLIGFTIDTPGTYFVVVSSDGINDEVQQYSLTFQYSGGGPVLYVDQDATPGGDGHSWKTAHQSIQAALDAWNGEEIWVAEGTYYPTRRTDPFDPKTARFRIPSTAVIRGGFVGTESSADERDLINHVTVLSGDLYMDDIDVPTANNANIVVVLEPESEIDGFHVQRALVNATANSPVGGSVAIRNCHYVDNLAGTNAIYLFRCNVEIDSCVFRHSGNEHAIFVDQEYDADTLRVSNSQFIGCQGALAINRSEDSLIELVDLSVLGPNGNRDTWAIYLNNCDSDVLVQGCAFHSLDTNAPLFVQYSSVGVSDRQLAVDDCTFIGNTAHATGRTAGGIYTDRFLTVSGCEFRDNICQGPGAINARNAVVITDSLFENNSNVHDDGGAVRSAQGVSAQSSEFFGNFALTFGGAVIAAIDSQFVQCGFVGNTAVNGYTIDFIGMAVLRLSSCSFFGNSGAVRAHEIIAIGSVLWGNGFTTSIDSELISQLQPSLAFCCVEGLTGDHEGNGNIALDPMLVDPNGPDDVLGTADDDLRLAPGSPCIDAGDNKSASVLGVTSDLSGNPRFIDDPSTPDTGWGNAPIIDIGAYEFVPPDPSGLDGDANNDCIVDVNDISYVLFRLGGTSDGDANGDGLVDVNDISYVLFRLGGTCS